jgi:hypothetical protein
MKSWLRVIFLLAGVVLLPTEFYCVVSALETQGEVIQGLLWMLLWLNVVWMALFWWFPRLALGGLFAMGLLIMPYQVLLLDRLTRLNAEITRLVDSRLRLRTEGQPVPSTLDDYKFSDPQLRRFIGSYGVDENGRDFYISFFVVDPGISHSYNSKTGWFYYPD